MPRVHNDPEALAELAAAIATFRTALHDGEAALRYSLLENLHGTWADARYEEFQERLLNELDVIRNVNDEQFEDLERRLYDLQERLRRYHDSPGVSSNSAASSAVSAAASMTPAVMQARYDEYTQLSQTGQLQLGETNAAQEIDVRHIVPDKQGPDFWHHHGYSKDSYMALAKGLAAIPPLLQQGHTIEELRADERYRPVIDAFWSRFDPIRVTKFRDIYVVDGGRHRIAALQECGTTHLLQVLVTTMTPKEAPVIAG